MQCFFAGRPRKARTSGWCVPVTRTSGTGRSQSQFLYYFVLHCNVYTTDGKTKQKMDSDVEVCNFFARFSGDAFWSDTSVALILYPTALSPNKMATSCSYVLLAVADTALWSSAEHAFLAVQCVVGFRIVFPRWDPGFLVGGGWRGRRPRASRGRREAPERRRRVRSGEGRRSPSTVLGLGA